MAHFAEQMKKLWVRIIECGTNIACIGDEFFRVFVPCNIPSFKSTRSWKKTMAPHVIEALEKASQYLTVGHYSPHTMRAFMSSKESGLFVREGFCDLS
jgi:hypothetical protein